MTSIRSQYVEPVMFTCEVKAGPVATGHRMRATEFAALVGSRSFRCVACGAIHTWTTDTAWLGAGTRAAERAAAERSTEAHL